MKTYMHMRAWYTANGRMKAEFSKMLNKARAEDAPEDALYFDENTENWVCFSAVTDPGLLNLIHSMVMAMRVNNGMDPDPRPDIQAPFGVPNINL